MAILTLVEIRLRIHSTQMGCRIGVRHDGGCGNAPQTCASVVRHHSPRHAVAQPVPLPQRRNIAPGPAHLRLGGEILEPLCFDRSADAGHQVLVVAQIVPGDQHHAQDLVGADQVVQIGAGIVARGRAAAFLVERPVVLGVAGVPQVDLDRKSVV